MLPLSKDFTTQLIVGVFLAVIFMMTGTPGSLAIFLGIVGGLTLGLFTTTTKTSPKPPVIASSEGIDAGLKYWLFFMLAFVLLLGYSAPTGILLGSIAGLGGGWIIAWWGAKEEIRTQLPVELPTTDEDAEDVLATTPRRRIRKAIRKFRKARGFQIPPFMRR